MSQNLIDLSSDAEMRVREEEKTREVIPPTWPKKVLTR